MLVFGWLFQSAGDVQSQTVASSATDQARSVLARVRPAVIQVKGFFGSNSAKSFHGSGFAAGAGGYFVTNFHVIAEHVHHPDKYRLEYLSPTGATGPLKIIAIDVRHDLAVVKAEIHTPEPLKIVEAVPQQGTRAYSVGYPLDVGLTITEGVSNGKIEDAFDPRIHYSGALNSGMSGGPAVTRDGNVFGINVSVNRFSQLVSFLVPGTHAKLLVEKAMSYPVGEKRDFKADIADQMRQHSGKLLEALKGPIVTERSAGFALPAKLSPFMDCSASGDPTSDGPVQQTRVDCSAKAGVYLKDNLSSGSIQFTHYVQTTKELDAWRFTKRLSDKTSTTGAHGVREHVGPFACKRRNVTLTGFDANIVYCVRSLRLLKGLYDFTVRVSSLSSTRSGFTSDMDIFGVDFDGGTEFVQRYIEAMEWKP